MAHHEVVTPVPGLFYRRPSPDAAEYKQPGDAVAAGETVGLVEIMKNFHPIEAEAAGTLSEYLADDEDEVEAGQAVAVLDDGA
jgi:acetyl-CoA carboxylase biotin carboxyl carrier protein